jgi:hypothetical protein
MTNPFENDEQTATAPAEASATDVVTPEEPDEDEAAEALAEVDTPDDDELETVPAGAADAAAPKAEAKPKEAKTPARPPVPEGYVTPVTFAKLLTAHLKEKNPEAKDVPPQMIYSYMKNADPTKAGVKNPWPRYSDGGRENLLKADESLAWWDAKDARVKASKETKAEKDAKKAAKATEAAAAPQAEEAPQGPVVEAE